MTCALCGPSNRETDLGTGKELREFLWLALYFIQHLFFHASQLLRFGLVFTRPIAGAAPQGLDLLNVAAAVDAHDEVHLELEPFHQTEFRHIVRGSQSGYFLALQHFMTP